MADLGKRSILVVDDAPENIDILNALLQDKYQIKAAVNGLRALAIALSETPPDLILLDIMMPEMDGYEVCRKLKSTAETCNIPIIFVTALNEEADERRGLELGAADFITKPYSPAIVHARVATHLELKACREQLQSMVLIDRPDLSK
ncbi:MAG: response regulator [Sedimenticola sp.]